MRHRCYRIGDAVGKIQGRINRSGRHFFPVRCDGSGGWLDGPGLKFCNPRRHEEVARIEIML